MEKSILLRSLGLLAASSFIAPLAQAHSITNAKAAEFALHRVERLVILRKIDEAFQKKAASLSLEVLNHDNENLPAFKATIAQPPALDGSHRTVEIVLSGSGKALSYSVGSGNEPVSSPQWPGKDAVALGELALHHVEDHAQMHTEFIPFRDGLMKLTLAEDADASGKKVAVITLEAKTDEPLLKLQLATDGTIESAVVVPRETPFSSGSLRSPLQE